ncbi:MAG: hypothetical protein LBJ47_04810 [Tannerella sp.]|jgi:hypothetical protein|nr:hypothetical protein [Tannerella sp.]
MATTASLIDRIKNFSARTGKFSIGVKEFFELLEDIVNKIRETIAGASISMIYRPDVADMEALESLEDPQKGWAVAVLDEANEAGNACIYQYDGEAWNKTPFAKPSEQSCIPLAGTAAGKPVEGNLQVSNRDFLLGYDDGTGLVLSQPGQQYSYGARLNASGTAGLSVNNSDVLYVNSNRDLYIPDGRYLSYSGCPAMGTYATFKQDGNGFLLDFGSSGGSGRLELSETNAILSKDDSFMIDFSVTEVKVLHNLGIRLSLTGQDTALELGTNKALLKCAGGNGRLSVGNGSFNLKGGAAVFQASGNVTTHTNTNAAAAFTENYGNAFSYLAGNSSFFGLNKNTGTHDENSGKSGLEVYNSDGTNIIRLGTNLTAQYPDSFFTVSKRGMHFETDNHANPAYNTSINFSVYNNIAVSELKLTGATALLKGENATYLGAAVNGEPMAGFDCYGTSAYINQGLGMDWGQYGSYFRIAEFGDTELYSAGELKIGCPDSPLGLYMPLYTAASGGVSEDDCVLVSINGYINQLSLADLANKIKTVLEI